MAEEVDLSEEQDELFEHYKFIVDPGQEPLRVDKFLMDRIPNTSRSKIQTAAQSGTVLINEKPVKANQKVKPGNTVSMVMPYPVKEFELLPEDIPLDIVYEDDTLLVINKPAGMVVHPGFGNSTGISRDILVWLNPLNLCTPICSPLKFCCTALNLN